LQPGLDNMALVTRLTIFLILNLLATPTFSTESIKSTSHSHQPIIVMPFKLIGDLGNPKIDSEHKLRLEMANKKLRAELQKSKKYELVDEAASLEFSNKVTAALSNNDCDHCETALAKELKAKQIFVPWIYRLSQLVLTMHFVILDVESGKTVLKKALDFRGDNDQSWQRAIRYFVENVEKP
jgi:hypothetical protein